VGTIDRNTGFGVRCAVHPHGRGDNRIAVGIFLGFAGSPPRAWGQLHRTLMHHRPMRFTPTGVGTISGAHALLPHNPVHPHGRGDNGGSMRSSTSISGSPPRAWGQSEQRAPVPKGERFTPTGVGTIHSAQMRQKREPVHPHGRGDNACNFININELLGSPPRAWGQ